MWHKLSQNPESIASVFSSPPKLDDVRIAEVILHEDGPRLELRINLAAVPDRIPSRWPKNTNFVQVALIFWNIADLAIAGWTLNNRGCIEIQKDSTNSVVAILGQAFSITARYEFFRIDRIVGYEVR